MPITAWVSYATKENRIKEDKTKFKKKENQIPIKNIKTYKNQHLASKEVLYYGKLQCNYFSVRIKKNANFCVITLVPIVFVLIEFHVTFNFQSFAYIDVDM